MPKNKNRTRKKYGSGKKPRPNLSLAVGLTPLSSQAQVVYDRDHREIGDETRENNDELVAVRRFISGEGSLPEEVLRTQHLGIASPSSQESNDSEKSQISPPPSSLSPKEHERSVSPQGQPIKKKNKTEGGRKRKRRKMKTRSKRHNK